jgi:hypothetical protein
MNCDANGLAEKFWKLMDDGDVKPLKEGFFTDSMKGGILVDGVKVTSHLLHEDTGQQAPKVFTRWNNATWNSLDWTGIKSGFLSLGPLKRIKTSKSMHGWLIMGHQKTKILPDAMDSHKCPRCHEPDEMQEHILKCQHVGAHKKRYDLVHLLMKKIRQNNQCPTQEVFTKCVRSWLKSPETIIPDVSSVHDSQCDTT